VTIKRTGVPAGNLFPVGTTTITYTATDPYGNTTTATQTIVVKGPAVVFGPPGSQSAKEGTATTFSLGSFSGGVGPYTVTVDWGDGSARSTFSASPGALAAAHAYANDRSLPYTVNVLVVDATGASATGSFAVAVANVAPTVKITSPVSGAIYGTGKTLSLTASFTDPGSADTHTCTISWGDGSKPATGTITESNGSGTCTASTTYRGVGKYTIVVTVTDSAGAATTTSVTISTSKNGSAASSVFAYSIKLGPTVKTKIKTATKKQAKPKRKRAVSRGPARLSAL
jgi:hypothetical protein